MLSSGVMAKGSVIVNGVRFDETTATIMSDDVAKTSVFLEDGMMVKVKGTVNDDGVTGKAEKIEVKNEARGKITSKGTDTMTVLGQTVFFDDRTVLVSGGVSTTLSAIGIDDHVEVHGIRDATGDIHASRIEKFAAGAAVSDEVRGAIDSLTPATATTGTFTIRGITLSYDENTTVVTPGATFTVGTLVEVHIGASNYAAKIEVEHLKEAEFEPAEGKGFEVEGYVSLFTGPTATFKVNDRTVSLSSTVTYEGGLPADLADGVRIEAHGYIQGGVLVAVKISFKENVKIKDIPSAVTASAYAYPDLVVMGLTVKATSKTLSTASAFNLINELEIRGTLNPNGTVTAVRIKDGGGGKPFLQGVVTDIDAGAKTFKIASILVSAGSASAKLNDDSGTGPTVSLSTFFSSLTASSWFARGNSSGRG
jgi:hypothetical protein